jgi:hypothetical protein
MLHGRARAEQRVHDAVHGEQSDGGRDTLPDLARRDGEQRAPVRVPRHPQGRADQLRHRAERGQQCQVEAGVLVFRPAHVVAQRAAEQLPFGIRDLGLGHPYPSEEPLHRTPPDVGQFRARYEGPWVSSWKTATVQGCVSGGGFSMDTQNRP